MAKNTAPESYAREKIGSAVEIMATSAASIQDRLFKAWESFYPVGSDDFTDPEDAQMFTEIYDALTAVEAKGDEGLVRATLNAMSDAEAERVADLIVSLNYSLRRD